MKNILDIFKPAAKAKKVALKRSVAAAPDSNLLISLMNELPIDQNWLDYDEMQRITRDATVIAAHGSRKAATLKKELLIECKNENLKTAITNTFDYKTLRKILDAPIQGCSVFELNWREENNILQAKLLVQQGKLKKTNAQLLEVNGELRQFVYVASHDLKEPVRMIGSYAKVLEDKYSDALDAKGLEYLGFVKNGAVRMNDLIDGLLKYSLIGKDKPVLKRVNIEDVLVICQSNLRLLIENSNATIEIGEMPLIYGDFNLLVQLMQNLIYGLINKKNLKLIKKRD